MMKIIDFEKTIDPTILKRGSDYFSNGYVAELEENGGLWVAEVNGSENYNVEITINKIREIVKYSCDCPYDGMICKHTVAVLYAIQKELLNSLNVKKSNVFENILNKVTATEYQKFIRSYSLKNKKFKTEFELYFSDKDERVAIETNYRDLLKKIIRNHKSQGFINYSSSNRFAKEVEILINTGYEYLANNNVKDAFLLVKAILHPLTETIEYSDDSNGSIGNSIGNTIDLLEKIIEKPNIPFDIKEKVFDFTRSELNKKIYFDYGDFGDGLLYIFETLSIELSKTDDFINYIDIEVSKLNGKHDNYRKENLQKIMIQFLKKIGKNDEAEIFILQNMDIVEVRLNEVSKNIMNCDYNTAKKLILEGIKIAEDKKHPGTVSQWNRELLKIAILEKDIKLIRYFTRLFAFDNRFSKEYYNQWKSTFSNDNWKNEIENHINERVKEITNKWESDKNNFWSRRHPQLISSELPSIFIEEGFLDRLLLLVQQEDNLNTILYYHPYLIKMFPKELIKIYIPILEIYGVKMNDRSGYADLVNKMEKIIKDIPEGKEEILAVARKLREQFSVKPRRPAMIEELDKLLK